MISYKTVFNSGNRQPWEEAGSHHSGLTASEHSVAFLLQCKHRSILGTGCLTVGLGANTSPRLDGVTHEFLA